MRLVADNLTCERGGREIFTGVGFTLAAGEFLELRGPNGAGKTSLLRMLAGLLEPAAGRLELEGGMADVPLAQHCHFVAHQDALKPALSVRENLEFWAEFLGGNAHDGRALEVFRLEALANLPAAFLSAGQKRRLALSRLVVRDRPIWLLDEPSVGLDAASRQALCDLMRSHMESGGLILATTHADLGLAPTRLMEIGTGAVAVA